MLTAIKRAIPAHVRHSLRGAVERWRARSAAKAPRPSLYNFDSPERIGIVYESQSDMMNEDRIMLYALVRGLRPERALEIGAYMGGSGRIMANAMEENQKGRIIGIDPIPAFTIDRSFHGRYTLLGEASPGAVPRSRELAGGEFDFILIDGIHTLDAVNQDIAAVLPHLAAGGHIFFHDAFNHGVNAAIEAALLAHPDLEDLGFLCRSLQPGHKWSGYGGVRLLRKRAAEPAGLREMHSAFAAAGKPCPPPDPDILNHDDWFCREIRPCERCKRLNGAKA